jgi:hypothetical protein
MSSHDVVTTLVGIALSGSTLVLSQHGFLATLGLLERNPLTCPILSLPDFQCARGGSHVLQVPRVSWSMSGRLRQGSAFWVTAILGRVDISMGRYHLCLWSSSTTREKGKRKVSVCLYTSMGSQQNLSVWHTSVFGVPTFMLITIIASGNVHYDLNVLVNIYFSLSLTLLHLNQILIPSP